MTRFLAEISENADWTIEIRDDMQALVKTLSGQGASIDEAWLGDDVGGLPLDNGEYGYSFEAASVGGSSVAPPALGSVSLDDTLAVAIIISKVSVPRFARSLSSTHPLSRTK